MKKMFALLLVLTVLLTACNTQQQNISAEQGGGAQFQGAEVPAVSLLLPAEQTNWTEQGAVLEQKLEELGCMVTVLYAENDPQRQKLQMQDQINAEVDCLVIAAVDSFTLAETVDKAKEAGIPVVAYDRLLLQTGGVSCYVGYDSYANGVKTGEFVVQSKQLQTAAEENRSYTAELFMGSPENFSSLEFYRGVMSVLQPWFDSGVLVCPSGYVAFEDVCIQNADAELTTKQCRYILNHCYTEKMPDILITASESLTVGVCDALEFCPAESWPLITGQGMEGETETRLQAGQQAMTIRLDEEALTGTCVQQVQALLTQQFAGGDSTYDNGTTTVPAFLLQGELTVPEESQEEENDTQSG